MNGIDCIRHNGWFQGAVLRVPSSECDAGAEIEPGSYVVISQDCDIVARTYEIEPEVELIPIQGRDRVDGAAAFAKNPRIIDFPVEQGAIRLDQRHKTSISRDVLERYQPVEPHLGPDEIFALRSWLAGRYLRSAFPDEFMERISPKVDKIKKILKRKGEHISGIYVILGDVPDDEGEIETQIVLTVLPETVELEGLPLDVSHQAKESLQAEFDDIDGISLDSCEVLSEDEFTLSELRRSLRLDRFDYLSLSGADHATPPA